MPSRSISRLAVTLRTAFRYKNVRPGKVYVVDAYDKNDETGGWSLNGLKVRVLEQTEPDQFMGYDLVVEVLGSAEEIGAAVNRNSVDQHAPEWDAGDVRRYIGEGFDRRDFPLARGPFISDFRSGDLG